MTRDIEAYIRTNRVRAAYHEAGHIQLSLRLAKGASIDAYIDDWGGGKAHTVFPKGTHRHVKLVAAVAGFLAEAKGVSGKLLSEDRGYVRMVAADLDRRLRSGETKMPVTVLMTDGEEVPSATNSDDFAFLLEELKQTPMNLRDFLARDPWANPIDDAMQECIRHLGEGGFWDTVREMADRLLDRGWFTTET